jgi:hypothetical protein
VSRGGREQGQHGGLELGRQPRPGGDETLQVGVGEGLCKRRCKRRDSIARSATGQGVAFGGQPAVNRIVPAKLRGRRAWSKSGDANGGYSRFPPPSAGELGRSTCFGPIDLRAQAEVPSARRTDTPKQVVAKRQVCPRLPARAPPDGPWRRGRLKRAPRFAHPWPETFPRKRRRLARSPNPGPWSPPPGSFRSWHAPRRVSAPPVGLSASTREWLRSRNNRNGQAPTLALNGCGASHQLANWLAATLPNLFGADTGGNDLASLAGAAHVDGPDQTAAAAPVARGEGDAGVTGAAPRQRKRRVRRGAKGAAAGRRSVRRPAGPKGLSGARRARSPAGPG